MNCSSDPIGAHDRHLIEPNALFAFKYVTRRNYLPTHGQSMRDLRVRPFPRLSSRNE